MSRTLTRETAQKIGQEVEIQGWVNARRNMGKIVFLDVRDRSGLVQVVCVPGEMPADFDVMKDVRPEYVVAIRGLVQERNAKSINPELATGKIEILAKGLQILAKAEPLPLDPADEKMGLDVFLDLMPLTLRTEKERAIFKVQAWLVEGFRKFLLENDFTEFQAPKLVGASTEGGANVFKIGYFGHEAFLAQSPQFYKQIMVGVFERVFTVGNVYRAEESATTRHLSEFTSLDLEMGFIKDHTDIMRLENDMLIFLMKLLSEKVSAEIKLLGATLPIVPAQIPSFKLREALALIKEGTGVDHTAEPDLEPNEEQWLCEYARKKFNSDFVFITHYPTAKRPMYTYPDEAAPEYTKSFDLLFRGVEITTGGQRLNDYEQLVGNIKKWGLNPENFSFYLQAFKYGMPPEGGLAIGLERLTAKLLGLDNVKRATLFPRDLNRIDLQLSPPEYKTHN